MTSSIERVCRVLVGLGWAWFSFTAIWGMAAIPPNGHLGAGAAGTALAGATGARWHSVYPMWGWFSAVDPGQEAAITHHPFGIYWLGGWTWRLCHHHDIGVNLPAVVMSILTPPILYKLGKHCWGPVPGAAAVLGYVLLPLAVGYSIFNGLEGLSIFGSLVFFLGSVRYQRDGKKLDLLLTLIGALLATSGDWPGYLTLTPFVAWGFLRAFVFPKGMTPRVDQLRYARWWARSVAAMIFTLMLWVWLFHRINRIGDWLGAADMRGGGKEIPLDVTLQARKAWIEFSFTPFAIALGKIGAWVALARLLWKRRDEEILSLSMLFGAVVQYVAFKQGADVHIFWSQYFVPYYALAFAQLVATGQGLISFVSKRVGWRDPRVAWAGVALTVIPSIILAPDAVRSLPLWRATSGRYDDKGTFIRSQVDMLVVLRTLVAPHLRPLGDVIPSHGGARAGWEQSYALHADVTESPSPNPAYPFWYARLSAIDADSLKTIAKQEKLAIYGDTVLWTRGVPPGPIDAYSMGEREPNPIEWLLTNNVEPARDIGTTPDPWLTWEWRVHLDVPATPPSGTPSTLDEQRIAHNLLVHQGDADGAERMREQILTALAREPEAHFVDGTELMGVRVIHGVQPRLEVWFEAGGPTANDTHFQIRSHMTKRARFSTLPINETDREMAEGPILSTKLWKKGFFYVVTCVLNHRIGTEQYLGTWSGGPAVRGIPQTLELVTLE